MSTNSNNQHQLQHRYISFCVHFFNGHASDIVHNREQNGIWLAIANNGEIRSNYSSDIQTSYAIRTEGEK